MAVTVTSVSAAQGTGTYVKASVIEVTVSFTSDNAGNPHTLEAQISLDDGVSWHDCTLHDDPTYNGQGQLPGDNRLLLVMVRDTLDNNDLDDYDGAGALVRVRATDDVTEDQSSWQASGDFALQTFPPVFNSQPTMPDYVQVSADITLDASQHDDQDPSFVWASINSAQLDGTPTGGELNWGEYPSSGGFAFSFGSETSGEKQVYVRVYDEFYNASEIVSVGAESDPANKSPWLQREAPTFAICRVIGSTGSQDYTGIRINEDGTFSVQREVTLQLSCRSPIPVSYRLVNTSDVEEIYHVDGNGQETGSLYNPQTQSTVSSGLYSIEDSDEFLLGPTTNRPVVRLTTNRSDPTSDDNNTDTTVQVSVLFEDAAGNQATANGSIRLNTRLYLTGHKPLRSPDANYQYFLYETTEGGNEVIIQRVMLLDDEPFRAWRDIFYPVTHGYPIDEVTGEIDEEAAIGMNEQSDADHDAVDLTGSGSNKQVVYDSEGRPITVDWTDDGTKNYSNMVSSHVANLTYWVIDHTGLGDFRLEFERFDLDSRVFGPPYNPLAPYKGDVLVVYDATAPGALTPQIDEFGNESWTLADSTKLKEIWAYTGSGQNVMNLTTGMGAGANANGAFTTPWIRGLSKVVLVLYTDSAQTASGFKLKSSPAYASQYINYHVDEVNGQVWVHKHRSLAADQEQGAADNTTKRMTYEYLDGYVYLDRDRPRVSFDTKPDGTVTADWSYYNQTPLGSDDKYFLASHDDFVDYHDSSVYITPPDTAIEDTDKTKLFDEDGYGRIATGVTFDKDSGFLTIEDPSFLSLLTSRRLFADYYHHTYYRLTDDGYGDLTFRDKVIVADSSEQIRDYTWADVKIVNEGESTLEDGKVVFTYRGVDTNSNGEVVLDPADAGGDDIVDQVLNLEKPWDIQKGTKDETYNKMAMAYNASFIWDSSNLVKDGDSGNQATAGAIDILSYWKNRNIDPIPARSKGYGRVVWVLGSGTYPPTTAGEKRCSMEISGKYFTTEGI